MLVAKLKQISDDVLTLCVHKPILKIYDNNVLKRAGKCEFHVDKILLAWFSKSR